MCQKSPAPPVSGHSQKWIKKMKYKPFQRRTMGNIYKSNRQWKHTSIKTIFGSFHNDSYSLKHKTEHFQLIKWKLYRQVKIRFFSGHFLNKYFNMFHQKLIGEGAPYSVPVSSIFFNMIPTYFPNLIRWRWHWSRVPKHHTTFNCRFEYSIYLVRERERAKNDGWPLIINMVFYIRILDLTYVRYFSSLIGLCIFMSLDVIARRNKGVCA